MTVGNRNMLCIIFMQRTGCVELRHLVNGFENERKIFGSAFTERRCASAVYGTSRCLSECPSICVSQAGDVLTWVDGE